MFAFIRSSMTDSGITRLGCPMYFVQPVEINMAGDDTYQFGLTSGGRGGKRMGDTIITSYLNT